MTDITTLKKKQRRFYKSIKAIYCPVLKHTIYFTSDGLQHLMYKHTREPRSIAEQYMKLSCLTHVPIVITECKEVFEIRQTKGRIKGKIRLITRYALIYEVEPGSTIRVIIEQVGNGRFTFLSVMPHEKNERKKKEK